MYGILRDLGVTRISLLRPGPGIRMIEVSSRPDCFPYLFLNYSPSGNDPEVNDGKGDAIVRIDFSNTYRFKGLWNVYGCATPNSLSIPGLLAQCRAAFFWPWCVTGHH